MTDASNLARRVALEEAWTPSSHSEVCCLVYATQNGWKLPILFEDHSGDRGRDRSQRGAVCHRDQDTQPGRVSDR